jgi:hypothetical protein
VSIVTPRAVGVGRAHPPGVVSETRRALTVLALAFVLAVALAASPAGTAPLVVAIDVNPGGVGLAEARAPGDAPGADALLTLDAVVTGGWRPSAPGASPLRVTPSAFLRADDWPRCCHSGRAPPLA